MAPLPHGSPSAPPRQKRETRSRRLRASRQGVPHATSLCIARAFEVTKSRSQRRAIELLLRLQRVTKDGLRVFGCSTRDQPSRAVSVDASGETAARFVGRGGCRECVGQVVRRSDSTVRLIEEGRWTALRAWAACSVIGIGGRPCSIRRRSRASGPTGAVAEIPYGIPTPRTAVANGALRFYIVS